MNFLDMKTVYFTILTTDVLCTLVLVQLWRQSRERFNGTGLWALDYAFQTVGLLLILLRGSVPDWMSMVLANTIILSAALLGLAGLERFFGKEHRRTQSTILLAVFVLSHGYFTVVQPDLRVRSILISAALLVPLIQCAWLMLVGVAPRNRSLTRGVGLVYGAFSLVYAFRIIGLLTSPDPEQDYFHASTPETIVPLLSQILLILLTYSLSLLVNKRLLRYIGNEEAKFSRAFHCSPYPITLTRLSDGKVLEVNEAFVQTTGYSYEEALRETTLGLRMWRNRENRDAMVSALSLFGSARDFEEQFETKSGELRTGLFSAGLVTINNEESILTTIIDITDRKQSEEERSRLIQELQEALANIKTLKGLIPICAWCKKIRDDNGYWSQLEAYIRKHSDASFSHGICPECRKKVYEDIKPAEG